MRSGFLFVHPDTLRYDILLFHLYFLHFVADGQCFQCNNLAVDGSVIGLHKVGNLSGIPQTAGILCRPVWLVLDGDGIKFHAVLAQILHIVFQILCIVGPVLLFQFASGAVVVLGCGYRQTRGCIRIRRIP